MIKEFEVLADIISNTTNKVVKKDIVYKRTFETDNIRAEQYLDMKGKVINKYCMVIEDEKSYKLNHPYKDIVALIRPIEVKGLMYKSKRYKDARI